MGIGLIELIEPSDVLNYKLFFKHCILQTVSYVFILFILVWNKIFCSNSWVVFYIYLLWFVVAFDVTVLMVLCFCCSLCKIVGNQGFFSYRKYNMLGIATKTVLWEMSTNIYFRHCVIHYIAKIQSIGHTALITDVMFLCAWEFEKR